MKKILAVTIAAVLMILCTVPCVALSSPTPVQYYNVTTRSMGGGHAESNVAKAEVASGDSITLVAQETEAPFERWDITGDYEIVAGSLTATTLEVIPKSDLDVIAYFVGHGELPDDSKVDTSPTSPQTGDRTFGALAFAVMGASAVFIAAAIACKKRGKRC